MEKIQIRHKIEIEIDTAKQNYFHFGSTEWDVHIEGSSTNLFCDFFIQCLIIESSLDQLVRYKLESGWTNGIVGCPNLYVNVFFLLEQFPCRNFTGIPRIESNGQILTEIEWAKKLTGFWIL